MLSENILLALSKRSEECSENIFEAKLEVDILRFLECSEETFSELSAIFLECFINIVRMFFVCWDCTGTSYALRVLVNIYKSFHSI